MAVGNRAGESSTSSRWWVVRWETAPRVGGKARSSRMAAQRALEISAHLRRNQTNHFIHIAAGGVKALPACEPLGHRVQVGDLPIASQHTTASPMDCGVRRISSFLQSRSSMRLRSLMSVAWMNRPSTLSPSRRGVRNDDVPPESLGIRKPGSKPAPRPPGLWPAAVRFAGSVRAPADRACAFRAAFRAGTPNQVSWAWLPKQFVEVHIPRARPARDAVQMLLMSRSARCSYALTAWRRYARV